MRICLRTLFRCSLTAVFVVGAANFALAQEKDRRVALGERLAGALPQPLEGYSAIQEVEVKDKSHQVRVKRIYLDADKNTVLVIIVRSETDKTLKRRKATFLDPKIVKRNGEYKTINGQKFSILKIKGKYTAMTIIRDTYSVLYFGTNDKDTLLAHIVSTDFKKISAVK